MVHRGLIRPCFWGGYVRGGSWLTSHKHWTGGTGSCFLFIDLLDGLTWTSKNQLVTGILNSQRVGTEDLGIPLIYIYIYVYHEKYPLFPKHEFSKLWRMFAARNSGTGTVEAREFWTYPSIPKTPLCFRATHHICHIGLNLRMHVVQLVHGLKGRHDTTRKWIQCVLCPWTGLYLDMDICMCIYIYVWYI